LRGKIEYEWNINKWRERRKYREMRGGEGRK
jgi:hypothetical protein